MGGNGKMVFPFPVPEKILFPVPDRHGRERERENGLSHSRSGKNFFLQFPIFPGPGKMNFSRSGFFPLREK